jgi:hypothetical protein
MGTMWLHDSLELLAIALHEKKRQGITIRDSMNAVKIVCWMSKNTSFSKVIGTNERT